MKAVRLILTIPIAALSIPILGGVLQESAIAFGNGHLFGWVTALLRSFDFLPLAMMAAPLYAIGAMIVAGLSLGLERLVRRRSVWIWAAHGGALGALQLLWLTRHFGPSSLIAFGTLGSWLIVATGMWLTLSRGQAFQGPVSCA